MAVNWLRLSSVRDKGLEMMREETQTPGKERLPVISKITGISKNRCKFLFPAQTLGRILIPLYMSYHLMSALKPKKAQSSKEPITG